MNIFLPCNIEIYFNLSETFLCNFEFDNYRDLLNHLSSTNRCNNISPLLFDIEVFSFTTSFNAVIEDTENDSSSAVTISSIFYVIIIM